MAAAQPTKKKKTKRNISRTPRTFNPELAQWKEENRGVMAEIAESFTPPISKSYVSMVLSSRRSAVRGQLGIKVAELLREKGAPIK
jgi:hypothetical protein